MIYKYKVIELSNKSFALEEALNHFGKEGYKLVNFLLIEEHLQLTLEKEVED